jgi:hypothetical protein
VTTLRYEEPDNRETDHTDSSPMAWALHQLRAAVLHEELDSDPGGFRVVDWGATDDAVRTHEEIEVVVDLVRAVASSAPTDAILGWIGGVLSSALSSAAVEAVRRLIHRLKHRQERGLIDNFRVLADGRELVRIFPSAERGDVTVTTSDGRRLTTIWTATADELPPLTPTQPS